MKTKAAVLYAPETPLRIEELELGPVKAEDVLVRIVASGVCHSDLHVYHGEPGWPMPVVLGHEGAGIVEQTGAGVTMVRPGDHVVVNLAPFCGRCLECSLGRVVRCSTFSKPQGHCYDGGTRLSKDGRPVYHYHHAATYAHHAIVHETGAVPIARHIPLDKACLVGCALPAGVGAVMNTAQVRQGSTVVVIGCGGVGLNVVQGARLAGASRVIAVDVLERKLVLARDFGATDVIDASRESTVQGVMGLTGGRGADYAFEVIGKVETIMDAYNCVGPGGMAVVVGVAPDGSQLPIPARSLLSEKVLTGAAFGSTRPLRDFPLYLDLYQQGRLKIDELITKYARLEDINEAFRALEAGEVIRTVLLME